MGRRNSSRKIDILTGLPDEILFHILSFLPTKFSVRTSALAKRWRFLWKHVPNLQFWSDDFRGKKKKNLDIINRVVMLHEAKTVDTLSFRLSSRKAYAYQLETMIIYLIVRCVRNLCLHFDYQDEDDIACSLPRLLLTCKTLVDLKLTNCGMIPSSGKLFLPSLKKLNLSYVQYEDDESLPHLLSGCPVLEKLIINDCFRSQQENSSIVTVSSPTIKMLNVDICDGSGYIPEKTLIIDVPALIYLKVVGYDLERAKSLRKTMTSLIGAEISSYKENHMCDIDCTEHGRSIEFLSSLCHVSYLKISSLSNETLFDMVGTGSMPKFVNLTKLELDATFDWYNVVKFLEVADNLQVLVIDILDMPPYPYKEPKRVPPCMLSRLRTVKMYYFRASEDIFAIVRYILRNAQVLERMEICPTCMPSNKEKFDALQTISLFERVSKSCQVAFSTDEILKDRINMIKTSNPVFD